MPETARPDAEHSLKDSITSRAGECHPLLILDAGLSEYRETLALQEDFLLARQQKLSRQERLILTEHEPVFTIGKNGKAENLGVSEAFLKEQGIDLVPISRGGDVTYHGPGQLLLYPILSLDRLKLGVREYVHLLEEVMLATAADLGIESGRDARNAGVWLGDAKLGSIGINIKRGITMHGLALNINPDLSPFQWINPCGMTGIGITSIARELGLNEQSPEAATLLATARKGLIHHFQRIFNLEGRHATEYQLPTLNTLNALNKNPGRAARRRKPSWLKRHLPRGGGQEKVRGLLNREHLHTVCQSAACPNIWECFSRGTATFMILGEECTRSCRFCNIRATARPAAPDPEEAERIAASVRELGLSYVVLTSVTRDDLEDGGAAHFAETIQAIRAACGDHTGVEVLIPDFQGSQEALATVLAAAPDVLNHNIETVPSLYSRARPQASYEQSLQLLRRAAETAPQIPVKSGLMLGLGETYRELEAVLRDLRDTGCRILTLGQYLQPSPEHLPVLRYYTPEEFADLDNYARSLGFTEVASAPLVRSSYRAEMLLNRHE